MTQLIANDIEFTPEQTELCFRLLNQFIKHIQEDGLGEDVHGKSISKSYLRLGNEINELKEQPLIEINSTEEAPSMMAKLPYIEPVIHLNGRKLDFGQAMTFRVALSGGFNPAYGQLSPEDKNRLTQIHTAILANQETPSLS